MQGKFFENDTSHAKPQSRQGKMKLSAPWRLGMKIEN